MVNKQPSALPFKKAFELGTEYKRGAYVFTLAREVKINFNTDRTECAHL